MKINEIYQNCGTRETVRILDLFAEKMVVRFVPYCGECKDIVVYYKDFPKDFELLTDLTYVDTRVFK